jgi:hypothetical protein
MSQIILAGYVSQEIINSTLPKAYPGERQRVGFTKELSSKIIGMLLTSDIYGLLGSFKDTNKEMVKVVKGSYNHTTKSVDIIRGISKFATNEFEENCILFSRPSQIYIDFGVINPYILQSNVNNTIQPIVSNLLESAYRPIYLRTTDKQLAITTDNPAYRGLCKALFGLNTGSADTGVITDTDNQKIALLSQFIDWMVSDPKRLAKLISNNNV